MSSPTRHEHQCHPSFATGYPVVLKRQEFKNNVGFANGHPVAAGTVAPAPPSSTSTCKRRMLRFLLAIACAAGVILLSILIALLLNVASLLVSAYSSGALQIQIESALVSPLGVCSCDNQLNNTFWTIGFSFNNSKKGTTFYNDIGVGVYRIAEGEYRWTETATVKPFRQGHKNQTVVPARVRAWSHMGEHMEGVKNFNVTLGFHIRRKHWYGTESTTVVLKCKDLKVQFSPNASEGIMYGENAVPCSEVSFWWFEYRRSIEAVELMNDLIIQWLEP